MADPALVSWLQERAHLADPVLSHVVSKLEASKAFGLSDLHALRKLPTWSSLFAPVTAHKISSALDGGGPPASSSLSVEPTAEEDPGAESSDDAEGSALPSSGESPGGWVRLSPPWPGKPYSVFCPDSSARCLRLNDSHEAVRTDCFEPEPETYEALASLLLGCDEAGGGQNCSYIDIGCNMGLFAAYAARLGASVQCFEPQPIWQDALRRTASAFPRFEVHQAAVLAADGRPLKPVVLRTSYGYRPCGLGPSHANKTVSVPGVPMRSLLRGRETTLLKIDIDSIEGALLHSAVQAILAGEARVQSILVELGCNHYATDLDPKPRDRGGCVWEGQRRNASAAALEKIAAATPGLRHPRGGDVHDLWRLQQAGYDVYRVNIHTNHEIYDWRGDDLNKQPTPTRAGFVPLHFVRAFRKLELLERHKDSSRYAALVSRANSFLITRVRLAELRRAQPKDLAYAGIRREGVKGGIGLLNRGNPVLAGAGGV